MSKQSLVDRILSALAAEEAAGHLDEEAMDFIEQPAPKKKRRSNKGWDSKKVNHDKILAFVESKGLVKALQVQKHLKAGQSTTMKYLAELVANGALVFTVKGKTRHYALANANEKEVATEDDQGTLSDRVLQFASDHMGEKYTTIMLADELGIKLSSAYATVSTLQKRKLLPKDFKAGRNPFTGSAKPINPAVGALQAPEEEVPQQDVPSEDASLEDKIEFLVWNFVKETRSTDVLHFLSWIESK